MHSVNWLEAFIGALFGLLLGAVFSDTLKLMFSVALQKLFEPATRQIAGIWDSKYWYINDEGQKIEFIDTIELKQIGSYIYGRNESNTHHKYRVIGRLRNQVFFTGNWKTIPKEQAYHGTFQLVVDHRGDEMWGKWLGPENLKKVNHGTWQWKAKNLNEEKGSADKSFNSEVMSSITTRDAA